MHMNGAAKGHQCEHADIFYKWTCMQTHVVNTGRDTHYIVRKVAVI